MATTIADSEIQSLRRHLGYGNVSVLAYPYTPDGFFEIFSQVIAPNLQTALETTASTAVTVVAGSTTTIAITLVSVVGIVPYSSLVVDVGADAEVVMVKSVAGSAVTAAFSKAHPASGYPVALQSGVSTLRMLLYSADVAYATLQSAKITKTAGLKSVGKGEVVWQDGAAVLAQTLDHYRTICREIGDLVRVQPRWDADGSAGGGSQLSVY